MLAALIYPHQLFPNHPAISQADLCVLIEEPLFFTQYRFHAQKLVLHIASMDCYKRGRSLGGKWSHDAANRKKLPRSIAILQVAWPESGPVVDYAQAEVSNRFPGAFGDVESFHYPITTEQAVSG